MIHKVPSLDLVHKPPQHQVFINFRGDELRHNFISHLEKALSDKYINVFIDEHISTGSDKKSLLDEIEKSKIVIVVISSRYTQSEWCLKELAKVKERFDAERLKVFPVFYKIAVNTVKKLKGDFGDQFRDLTEKFRDKKEEWESALEFVTDKLGGVKVKEKSRESSKIVKIVKKVMVMLDKIPMDRGTNSPGRDNSTEDLRGEPETSTSSSSKEHHLFGIETRLEQLKEKLNMESNMVTRVIGVVGIPGIGKTTLAKKLFDDFKDDFWHRMFLDDVRAKSKSPDAPNLQLQLLYGLTKRKYERKKKQETYLKPESLKDEVSKEEALIVLDDVSDKKQIEMLLGEREWLKRGSKVVITTNSKSVVDGMVDEVYLVPGLSDNDALNYFKTYAFSNSCNPSFMKLAREFVEYSRGHPLALKALGGELLGKQKSYWESKYGMLARSPISNTIQNVLRTPYDDLSLPQKDLFLDVACLFRFEDEFLVRSVLDSPVHENVSDLADKFLINICGGRLEVNDLMYTLAKGLESQSFFENSTSGRRLNNHGEIITALLSKEEATKVRGIFLDLSELPNEVKLGSDTFTKMKDLRYLKVFNSSCPKECKAFTERKKESKAVCKLKFPNGFRFKLEEIRYLHWLKFPLKIFPRQFDPKNLIDLKLPWSEIEQLWKEEKDISKLRWLDLNHSSKLHTLSGLSLARNLESLNLEGCTRLKINPGELKNMESLKLLNLRGCTSLDSLPEMNLISLKTLILSGCSNLDKFNLISENLEELYLDGTAIKELPSSIDKLQKLVLLKLKNCTKLLSLPDSIGDLKLLETLILSGCKSLASFPQVTQNMKHLKTLLLDGTAIEEIHGIIHQLSINQGQHSSLSQFSLRKRPYGINGLSSVQRLCLSRSEFKSLPESIINLYNLKWLELKCCNQLTSLPMLPPNLRWLDAHGCISLKKIEKSLSLLLVEAEHSHSTFIFTNCIKLDQDAKNSIVSYTRRKIQLMSDALVHQDKGSILDVLIRICYPGWQLPVWFNHRVVGSEMKQKLPRHWYEDGLTGIALCVVVSIKDYRALNTCHLVRCTSKIKEEGEPLIKFSCILGGWTKHASENDLSDKDRDIIESSGHVFIGYTNWLHVMKGNRGTKCVATEISFKFEVTDGAKKVTNCEVVKCGFTLIYAPTKHVHSLDSKAYSDYGERLSGSTNSTGGTNQNQSEAISVPERVNEEVKPSKPNINEGNIHSKANSDVPLSTSNIDDATPEIGDNTNGESTSPVSSGECEVMNEEHPNEEKVNSDHGEKLSGSTSSTGGTIEIMYNQNQSEATSVPEIVNKEVKPSEPKINKGNIQSKANSVVPLSTSNTDDATPEIGDNNNGDFTSPVSSGDGEVVNEVDDNSFWVNCIENRVLSWCCLCVGKV